MIKAASELKPIISTAKIVEFLEDYIMEGIEKANQRGSHEHCASSYSISCNRKTGELVKGLESDTVEWAWYSIYDSSIQDTVINDFARAGYKVFQKPGQRSYFVGW